jgi:hypothetical protein
MSKVKPFMDSQNNHCMGIIKKFGICYFKGLWHLRSKNMERKILCFFIIPFNDLNISMFHKVHLPT